MDISSIVSAKVRTLARLLEAMDQGRETRGLIAQRKVVDDQIRAINQAITEIESLKKEKRAMGKTENELIAERFVDGTAYLGTWKIDKAVRQEFADDFAAYCHFKHSEALGLIKILQGQQKI